MRHPRIRIDSLENLEEGWVPYEGGSWLHETRAIWANYFTGKSLNKPSNEVKNAVQSTVCASARTTNQSSWFSSMRAHVTGAHICAIGLGPWRVFVHVGSKCSRGGNGVSCPTLHFLPLTSLKVFNPSGYFSWWNAGLYDH